MNIFQDIEKAAASVLNFFKKAPQEAQDVLTATNKFLNIVKTLSTSATGQTIIDLAEAFFPAATGLVNGVEAVLSELLGLTSQTPGQLLLEASQKAIAATGLAMVTGLNNIATIVASTANDLTKGNLTPQQIASVIQLVHNPDVLSNPATVSAPVVAPNASTPASGS